jgi:hypothetical protein
MLRLFVDFVRALKDGDVNNEILISQLHCLTENNTVENWTRKKRKIFSLDRVCTKQKQTALKPNCSNFTI